MTGSDGPGCCWSTEEGENQYGSPVVGWACCYSPTKLNDHPPNKDHLICNSKKMPYTCQPDGTGCANDPFENKYPSQYI